MTRLGTEDGQGEFHSVENTLKEKLSEEDHANVTRVLYGLNQGKTVEELPIPQAAQDLADKKVNLILLCINLVLLRSHENQESLGLA